MKRHQTYMILLIIAILTSLFNSCGEGIIDKLYTKNYIYTNETNFSIEIEDWKDGISKAYTLAPSTQIVFQVELGLGNCTINDIETSSNNCLLILVDSLKVVFDNTKTLILNQNDTRDVNILMEVNYDYKKNGQVEYFNYSFTQKDYEQAQPIVFIESFIGSSWRCTAGAGLQEGLVYNEFRFVSATQVEGWALFQGETQVEHFFTANYQINGEEISITDEGESFIGRLNEDYTGLITNIDEEGECVFFRQ